MISNPTAQAPASPSLSTRLLAFFQPAAAAPLLAGDTETVQRSYRRWQTRVLASSIVGYGTYYFVRKNLAVAMPVMEHDLHIRKAQLGLFLTLHGVLYGVSKFANGFLGDRCNARAFMVTGLFCSAILNVLFGMSWAVPVFGALWMLNGWFQGMGFPPCARLLTHWFPPKRLATKMSQWNISHQAGGGLILILCGWLVAIHWRLCFFVPAAIAFAVSIYLWFMLPDTPRSVGLPEVEGTPQGTVKNESHEEFRKMLMQRVFRNKYIWLISIANFFVYILRYAVFDWGPTVLTQAKGIAIGNAAWMVAGFEFFGLFGALFGGWITDRLFGGRAMRVGVFYMALAIVSLLLFWKASGQSKLANAALLCATGFFIYGPQCLIGIAAANLATRQAAATSVGLTGFFGYASTVLSGWGLGALVDRYGWDAGFLGMTIAAVIGTALFVAAWGAKAHGYEEDHA